MLQESVKVTVKTFVTRDVFVTLNEQDVYASYSRAFMIKHE